MSAAIENRRVEEQLPGKFNSAGGLLLLTAELTHTWSVGQQR